jgi:TIR domain/PDZ domain
MPENGTEREQPFLYDAFISYRHVERDRKWAEWLIDALERYRVPKSLQQRGLPPRLRKIFRDEDEVPASADLNDQIKQALLASRFLIVVCSAFTPRSKWVEREIEIFNELGRGDQVLALLTEGEPGDSFPVGMLERHRNVLEPDGSSRVVKEDKEPLAADVRPRSGVSMPQQKRMALLRLVAVILGVKFDDLRQRDHEREVSRRRVWIAAAATLLLLISGAGYGYWEMMRPHSAYYRQIIWRWGLPEGLGQIDDETQRHLATHYSVTRQRDSLTQPAKVVEMRRQNSAGKLRAGDDGQAHWLIHYGPDPTLVKIAALDADENPVLETFLERRTSAGSLIQNLKRDTIDFAQAVKLVIDPESSSTFDAKADITRRELTLDDRGFAVKIRYQNHYGTPQHDADGSYGRNIVYSSEGLGVRNAQVGADGNEITLRTGVRATTFAYDAKYNQIDQILIGYDEKPFEGRDGYARVSATYDRWGNLLTATFYAADGRRTLSKDGMAELRVTYDARGNIIEFAHFGIDGRSILNTNYVATVRQRFDDDGNILEKSYFDVNGQPTLSKEGIARINSNYNSRGKAVRVAYFDLEGRPTLGTLGYASLQKTFNDRGYVTEAAYYGVDGKLTLNKEGYAKITSAYNARRQTTKNEYFDTDGRLTLNSEGFAISTLTYDPRGNIGKVSFFGVDGRPTLYHPLGIASMLFDFDDRGTVKQLEWFGIDDQLTLGNVVATAGCARIRMMYDDRGNVKEQHCIGVDGKLGGLYGVAIVKRGFDDRGNRIQQAAFGPDGRPTESRKGAATIKYAYDTKNREVERAFFGLDGARALLTDPFAETNGFAGFWQSYDDRGNLIEKIYFGLDAKPILSREKFAKMKSSYNARGQEIERIYFDTEGKPTISANGYASFHQEFDARGNLIEADYFGVDGKPVSVGIGYAKVRYEYDNLGRESRAIYFDDQKREITVDLIIASVIPGTTADRIGLALNDRILRYDGKKPNSLRQFVEAVTNASGHRARDLIVHRDSRELKFEVAPGRLGVNVRMALASPTQDARESNSPAPDHPDELFGITRIPP